MILLLVLRRSMLHALGFTYADLLPLHRGMGFAIIFWSTIHTSKFYLQLQHGFYVYLRRQKGAHPSMFMNVELTSTLLSSAHHPTDKNNTHSRIHGPLCP